MQRYLRKEGFCVRTAGSGERGLRLARQLLPVAITLDVMMPDMDGWSVLSALKADADAVRHPGDHADDGGRPERGFTLGASEYATKPVESPALSQILKKYTCPHAAVPGARGRGRAATRA